MKPNWKRLLGRYAYFYIRINCRGIWRRINSLRLGCFGILLVIRGRNFRSIRMSWIGFVARYLPLAMMIMTLQNDERWVIDFWMRELDATTNFGASQKLLRPFLVRESVATPPTWQIDPPPFERNKCQDVISCWHKISCCERRRENNDLDLCKYYTIKL